MKTAEQFCPAVSIHTSAISERLGSALRPTGSRCNPITATAGAACLHLRHRRSEVYLHRLRRSGVCHHHRHHHYSAACHHCSVVFPRHYLVACRHYSAGVRHDTEVSRRDSVAGDMVGIRLSVDAPDSSRSAGNNALHPVRESDSYPIRGCNPNRPRGQLPEKFHCRNIPARNIPAEHRHRAHNHSSHTDTGAARRT